MARTKKDRAAHFAYHSANNSKKRYEHDDIPSDVSDEVELFLNHNATIMTTRYGNKRKSVAKEKVFARRKLRHKLNSGENFD